MQQSKLDDLIRSVSHQLLPASPRRFSSLGFALEVPEDSPLPAHPNRRYPAFHGLAPRDSAIARRRVCPAGVILSVLRVRRDPQIATTVVQLVEVDVIAFQAVAMHQTEDLAVQVDRPHAPVDVPTTGNVRASDSPMPLAYPVNVGRVDGGVSSNGPVTCTQREYGGQPIRADDRWGRDISACVRTIGTVGSGSRRWAGDRLTACGTGDLDGLSPAQPRTVDPRHDSAGRAAKHLTAGQTRTLNGHQVAPGVSPGVFAHCRDALLPSIIPADQEGRAA